MKNISLICLLFITSNLISQTLTNLGDFNPGPGSSATFEDHVVIYFNDLLIFTANTGTLGEEPMVYNGEETKLLLDIREGSESSEPTNYYIVNDKLIFSADDGIHGREWWTTDGTTEGTKLLLDLYPGEERGVYPGSSNPFLSFHHFQDFLLFVGTDREDNLELWKTDGTAEGTMMVKDIVPAGFFGDKPSFPESFVTFKDEVYFSCRDGFWKTDGTESGTVKIKSDHPTNFFGFEPSSLFATEDFILLVDDPGIWISDGTSSGTQILKELSFGSTNSFENKFNQVGPYVLFAGSDDTHGDELWRTDGTTEGTEMVIDLDPGSDGYAPQNTVIYKGEMYYKGDNGSTGIELYKTDGTASGTKLVKDIKSGSTGSFFLPSYIIADDNFIYFKAKQSVGKELWYSDGTSEGTVQIDINPSGDSSPNSFYVFDDKLFLFAGSDDLGFEPFIFDAFNSGPIDMDQDGFTDDVDCDDSDPNVNTAQTEIPFNDKDDDCNPETLDNDGDMDGYGNDVDCDDDNNLVNPAATEITYNGIDDDCDPLTLDDDLDGDGFNLEFDCNDQDSLINPEATEILGNDIDENCDGELVSSTDDLGSLDVEIFPNPANDHLNIVSSSDEILEIAIYSILGTKILSCTNEQQVDIRNLLPGTYILEIVDSKNQKKMIEKVFVE